MESPGHDTESQPLRASQVEPDFAMENSPRFARKDHLKRYIPELGPDNPRAQTLRVKMSKRSTMLSLQLGISILVAPTRKEIDEADRKGRFLEIGVPSFKNLFYIKRTRTLVWFAIGICSTLLHFCWNSAIFNSIPIEAIPRALATSDFLTTGDDWIETDPLSHFEEWMSVMSNVINTAHVKSANRSQIYELQREAAAMTKIDNKACIDRYMDPMKATGSLIIVARNISSGQNGGSSLIDGWVTIWDTWVNSNNWVCAAYEEEQGRGCAVDFMGKVYNDWRVSARPKTENTTWPIQVDHCLVGVDGHNDQRCGLHYSVHIFGTVCMCTFAECLFILTVWYLHRTVSRSKNHDGLAGTPEMTMVTMGDAIHEFLLRPAESCSILAAETGYFESKVQKWSTKKRVRLARAVSKRVWILTWIVFITGILVPGVSVGSSIAWLHKFGDDISLAAIFRHKFELRVNQVAIELPKGFRNLAHGPTSSFLTNILVANSPQLLMSFVYLFLNNIITRQAATNELEHFLREDGKKPLRVSSPIGMQRSSYFLALPFKYSIPVLGMTMLLHWLISQSLFLVQASTFASGSEGIRVSSWDSSARGFTPLGGILSLSVAMIVFISLIINSIARSYRDIPPEFERMGCNSSAIRLLCLRPDGDDDAHLFPISLGMVQDDRISDHKCKGRMAFSTDIQIVQIADLDDSGQYSIPRTSARGQRYYTSFLRYLGTGFHRSVILIAPWLRKWRFSPL
ncbi:hypothetical protein G7054_g4182 [Neopestalotiopsis clavispora]|nr:hypothetical protein G7054_g4182 [Neopestalotiopsis clavispora]